MCRASQIFWRNAVGRAIVLVTVVLLGACGTTRPPTAADQRDMASLQAWTVANGVDASVLLMDVKGKRSVRVVGLADPAHGVPMSTDTPFRIGSITKMFVGVVAAQLMAEGRLDAKARLPELLPAEITKHLTNADQITLQQLLRHMSGLYDYEGNPTWLLRRMVFDPHGKYTPSEALRYAYDKKAMFAPGKGWAYSNTNYLLIGMIIERVTGHSQAAEIRRRIIEPLKLAHTYYDGLEPPPPDESPRAHGFEHLPFRRDTTAWSPPIPGPGGIISTIGDVATFVRAVARDDGFLDAATRRVLRDLPWDQTEPPPTAWPVIGYYCGISTAIFKDYVRQKAIVFFGHDGAFPGYFTFAYCEPEGDLTIAFFGNTTLVRYDFRAGPDNPFFDHVKDAMMRQALKEDGYFDNVATHPAAP